MQSFSQLSPAIPVAGQPGQFSLATLNQASPSAHQREMKPEAINVQQEGLQEPCLANNSLNLNISTFDQPYPGSSEVHPLVLQQESTEMNNAAPLPDDQEELVQIPLSEFDLLQSCQKIIDAASSMKCIECEKVFQTTDFYDHIIVQRECIIESEPSESQQALGPHGGGPAAGLINESEYLEDMH